MYHMPSPPHQTLSQAVWRYHSPRLSSHTYPGASRRCHQWAHPSHCKAGCGRLVRGIRHISRSTWRCRTSSKVTRTVTARSGCGRACGATGEEEGGREGPGIGAPLTIEWGMFYVLFVPMAVCRVHFIQAPNPAFPCHTPLLLRRNATRRHSRRDWPKPKTPLSSRWMHM